MNTKFRTLAAASFALLLLAACGSSGGNIGDIFGGGSNTGTQSNEIRGTVDSVDLSSGSIYLTNVSGYNSMLSSGGSSGNSVRVFFDNRTAVDYQGRTYRPEDLERGDQIAVRVDQSSNNSRLYASSMTVLYDARGNSTSYPSTGTVGSNVRGTVRSVDTYRRSISVDTGYGSYSTIEYDTNTPVTFNGRSYMVADIEVGDEIDVRVQNLGSGRYRANDIVVTRSVSGTGGGSSSGTYGSTYGNTIRGTVSSVNTYNRTITLNSVNWTNFNRNTGGGGSSITISYDNNTQVDVNGALHPVSGLERGDVIEVQVDSNSGTNNYFARRIFLVRDVNSL